MVKETKAKDVMTKNVITLSPSDTVDKIVKTLSKNKISGCPVVKKGKLLGIVSDTDILNALDVHTKINVSSVPQFAFVLSRLENHELEKLEAEMKSAKEVRAKDIMTSNPVSIHEDEEIEKALQLMNKHDITRILVVDEKEKLKGVISKIDIVKKLASF